MKRNFVILSSALLFSRLIAGEQEFKLTSNTLDGWNVSGGPVGPAKGSSLLVLPAGAQLTRSFNAGTVFLHTTSRPYFGDSESGWPILVVGPIALIFKADSGSGQLLALGSNGSLQPVGAPVSLDASGHSIQPLDLELAYDPVTGKSLLAVADKTQFFQFSATVAPVDVVISAGAKASWTQDDLSLLVVSEDSATAATASLAPSSVTDPKTDKLKDTVAKFKTGPVKWDPATIVAAAPPKPAPKTTTRISLEVFSVPSIRQAVSAQSPTVAAATNSK